jgi:small subunit ribosomal protein S20
MRTRIKRLRSALDAGDADTAKGMMNDTLTLVDKSVKLGVLHRNAAARTKSRLTRALARIEKGA